jgi:hypothetical protein
MNGGRKLLAPLGSEFLKNENKFPFQERHVLSSTKNVFNGIRS